MDSQRCYLGDGVYARVNYASQGRVILSTDNGIKTTNEIVLEPEVLAVFMLWLEQIKGVKEERYLDTRNEP
jgi:hypothetical protein